MALTDENGGNGFYMPVAPAYGGGNGGFGSGFGGDWGWIVLLLLLAGGGWGMGGFGGGFGGGYDFPWLLTGQQQINTNTNNGFRDQMINDNITSVRDSIAALATQLCQCCADMSQTVNAGFANAETAANSRQMANMQQMFSLQSALQNCCCENRAGIADLKYTVATENCADRQALNEGVRDIIANQTAGTQRILDKLCDQELQAERRENQNLRSELMFARGQASQIAQNSTIIDGIYNRLNQCPVGTVPVYGEQPIFTCPNNNNGCGCGCNGGF